MIFLCLFEESSVRISLRLSCTSLLCISMFTFPFLSPRLSSMCFSCRRFSGRERPGWGCTPGREFQVQVQDYMFLTKRKSRGKEVW